MKLAFKFKPKFNELQSSIIEELSYHTTKLYNIANYDNLELGVKSYVDMNKLYNSNWHKDFLHSHNYQHCLKVLEKNWKSYFASIKDYKNNHNKYLGMPKPPKYKNHNDRKNEVIYTKLAIRFKDNTLMLSLSKVMQNQFGVKSLNFEVSDKLQSLFDWNSINQVKIKWDHSVKNWFLILIYEKAESLINTDFNNIMSIDLGLSNLGTITFLNNDVSYIVNGKSLKSVNSFVNKKIAYLQSIAMSMTGSKIHKDTKLITKLRRYRENYIHNYLHKASRQMINLALQYKCKTIVIGDLKGIKQNMNYSKTFAQVPISKFAELIEYKAKLIGIEVIYQKEAYTSGCSALDLEKIEKSNYNKNRRVFRGLFNSNQNIKVNADVNGSLNILRLYTKDKCIPKLIISARDKGYVNNPIKLKVA